MLLSDGDPSALFLILLLSFGMSLCRNIASSESEPGEELGEELEEEEDEIADEGDERKDVDNRFGVEGLILDCADTGIENATLGDLRASKLGTFELDSSCFDCGLFGSGRPTPNSVYISK